jgi:hypothetical protein
VIERLVYQALIQGLKRRVEKMNRKEAYRKGVDRGESIGESCLAENFAYASVDAYLEQCGESEENDRQFSPFEFLAHDINSHEEFRAEGLWEAFDRGISVGFNKAWRRSEAQARKALARPRRNDDETAHYRCEG